VLVGSPKPGADMKISEAAIEKEQQALKDMFKEFDVNGDGRIRFV